MNLVLGICAAVAALVGVGLLWWRSRVGQRDRPDGVDRDERRGQHRADRRPARSVEVKGTLRVRVPLVAEFSQKPCAYFKCEIEREETYYERDCQGRDERKTRTTTVYSNMKYGQCLIEDASGRVGIDFDGATVEAIQTVNEPTAAPNGGGSGIDRRRAVGAVQLERHVTGARKASCRPTFRSTCSARCSRAD